MAITLSVWVVAAAFKLVGIVETGLTRDLLTMITAVCGLLIFAIVVLALLRAIVYFRDVYRDDPNAGIPLWEQLKLLVLYILGRVDVHGGYFDGDVTQRLIYRLAGLGFDQSLAVYGGEDAILGECADHQIRVMLSNRLRKRALTPPEAMDLSDRPA